MPSGEAARSEERPPGQAIAAGLQVARVSAAQKERAYDLLRQACVDDRLTLDELGQRVELVERAMTTAELQSAIADLAAAPARLPRPAVSTTAVMSEVSRVGRWRVAERIVSTAVMGKCKLDLRHAVVEAPVTTISARVLMGELEVIVPRGVEVELDTTVVMGNRSLHGQDQLPPEGAPVVRITGVAVMGAVNVRVAP